MRLHLLCIGKRPPAWVASAVAEYRKRLTGALEVQCRDLPPATGAVPAAQQREREGVALLRAVPPRAFVVVLDEQGTLWSTAEFARELEAWRAAHQDVALIVGGAEGLAPAVKAAAGRRWSLSRLTLPHQLVRVVVLEQLYRAWSLLNNHPYHRA